MLKKIHADYTVSLTELKKNPHTLIENAHGEVIALLNRNRPIAYIIPAETYERIIELADDLELGGISEDYTKEAEPQLKLV